VLPASARVGITLNLSPVHPAENTQQDRDAAWRMDLASNRIFLDPLLLGRMPAQLDEVFGFLQPRVDETDLQLIAQPLDFLGVNYYSRNVIRHDALIPFLKFNQVFPEGNEYSQMWEIYPPGLYEILERVWVDYLQPHHPHMRILITENGVPVPDGVDMDERVRDERRIRYLQAHLEQLWQAIQSGVPVDGYFHWSLLDNFEWAHGYRMRFGLIYVDFEMQKRLVKDSGRGYQQVIANNGLAVAPA
jgi:beta-glucosidase